VESRYNRALNPEPPPPGRMVLPASCCPAGHEGECLGGGAAVHTGDCFTLSLAYLQHHAATLGAAALGVTCLMVSWSLSRHLPHGQLVPLPSPASWSVGPSPVTCLMVSWSLSWSLMEPPSPLWIIWPQFPPWPVRGPRGWCLMIRPVPDTAVADCGSQQLILVFPDSCDGVFPRHVPLPRLSRGVSSSQYSGTQCPGSLVRQWL
jgi:hypothetical protein